MAKVKVKICGITNWADAKSASDAGADFLGFNFYPRSPRYIRPATARKIVRRLPKGLSTVGVFVNETERNMLKIAQAVGLDYLQLHGDESAEMVVRLGRQVPVIKAVRVSKSFRVPQLAEFKRSKALLLDAFQRKLPGGTGRTFDWNIAHRARRYGRVFLAGGLTPENIGEAIRIGKPFAVDVCSGVEAAPGKKDPARIKALMSAARPSAGRPAAKRVVHSRRKGTR